MIYIRWFSEITSDDVATVGGKNAGLGELYRSMAALSLRVPNGFAVTADAFKLVLERSAILPRLHTLLDGIERAPADEFDTRAHQAQRLVEEAPLPAEIEVEIVEAYRALRKEYGTDLRVAVRSSATAEDLPTASFAGQHITYLNVDTEEMVLAAYRKCLGSLFLARAIHYRIDQGFDHFKVALSVGIMKMVRSDLAASGVIFTIDTETGFRDVVMVSGSYGLGENIVQGTVDPDQFYVHKPTYNAGYRAVLRRSIGAKQSKLIFDDTRALETTTTNVETPAEQRLQQCISDTEVLALAGASIAIERHMSKRAGGPMPMDIEWAKDGVDGALYIVQARPETVASQRAGFTVDSYELSQHGEPLLTGKAIGTKIASGAPHVAVTVADLSSFKAGDVLVAETTSPDWEPVMKLASAIVTDRGGRTCHAAILARELGIPAIVGTATATRDLRDHTAVTVSCAEGETGRVYAGTIPFTLRHLDVSMLPRLPVEIMITVGNPESAFADAMLPNDGVGLARLEFIFTSAIGIHPMAAAHPERVDEATRAEILKRTHGYSTPKEFVIERLAEGVGTIAAAFYPKPVIVRMSDFKTNEYAKLLGGSPFEPSEDNPMLGFRGASRYAHPAYADGFALECAAIKRVRETMGLKNVIVMIPFCRRVQEGERVIARMAELGLRREDGLKIYVMCEIPNNVIQIDAFSRIFDGFSIGSNDLTQLVLGVDRDSEIVAFDFDERDEGVRLMLRQTIEGAKRNGRYVGICGQAPSDYPEMAKYLMELGIDSISLNADSVTKTMLSLAPKVSA